MSAGGITPPSGQRPAPPLIDAPVASFLERTAGSDAHAATGTAAALAVALAAALASMAARRSAPAWDEARGAAGQAEVLRARAQDLTEDSARAYAHALDRLSGDDRDQTAEQRDWSLGVAVTRAGAVPMAVGEIGADVAELAAHAAGRCDPGSRPDAVAGAVLAEAAVRMASGLVQANLTVGPGDGRLARVNDLISRARSAVERCPSLSA